MLNRSSIKGHHDGITASFCPLHRRSIPFELVSQGQNSRQPRKRVSSGDSGRPLLFHANPRRTHQLWSFSLLFLQLEDAVGIVDRRRPRTYWRTNRIGYEAKGGAKEIGYMLIREIKRERCCLKRGSYRALEDGIQA